MMNNGLLICPQCSEIENQKRILGSIDANGALHIKRRVFKGEGYTTIMSSSMTIICSCGFGTTVSSNYVYATPAHA